MLYGDGWHTRMQQKINLYSRLPQTPKPWLSLERLAYLSGLFLFLLLLIYGYLQWKYHHESARLAELKQQSTHLNAQLSNLMQQLHKMPPPGSLKHQLEEMRQAVINKTAFLKTLQESDFEEKNTGKFSEYLINLGQHVPDGLWLTRIIFTHDKSKFLFSGITENAKLVPKFMQNMQHSINFQDKILSIVKIERSLKNSHHLDFILQTKNAATLIEIAKES